MPDLIQLTANISGKTRKAQLNGREHIVAPLTLIVPGVLNGSRGPLLYPADEVSKNPSAWNHVPIVVYHPTENGQGISARDPDVLNKQGIGVILRANANGKLTGEAWFDIDATARVDNRILDALNSGKPIELSTGLFTDDEPAPSDSEFNGVAYTHIARNYRPDHLAILPDQKGACSISDGCGVLVNEESKKPVLEWLKELVMSNKQKEPKMKEHIDFLIANCNCWKEEDRETLNELGEEKVLLLRKQNENNKKTIEKADQQEAVYNSAVEGFEDQQGDSHKYNVTTNSWEHTKKEEEIIVNEKKIEEQVSHQTAEEWYAGAPEEIQTAVRNSLGIVNEKKALIVEQLLNNSSLETDEQKQEFRTRWMTKSLDDLQEIAIVSPAPKSVVRGLYEGAASPVGNIVADKVNKADILPLPEMNYSEKQA